MAIALSQLTIQASFDATAYTAGANAKVAADKAMVDSGDKVAASVTATEQRLSTSATAYDRLAKSIDPAFAATTKLAQGQSTIQRAFDAGKISIDEFNQRTVQLQQRYGAVTSGVNDNTRVLGLNRQGLLELQASGVNAFQALASGMSVFRVAETEGAQAIGAFVQGGKLSIATLIGWVAPLAAVAVGVALITSTIVESNSQLRTFNTILSGMGTASLSSGAGLQTVVKQLRDTGTAAADALAAVEAVTRTQGINPAPANVSMITNLARDIGAVTGGSIVDESKKLSDALAAGEVSAEKFAFSLAGPNGLTAAEAASAQAMAKHGDTAGALNVILAALQRQFAGEFRNNLSETTKLVEALSKTWHGLLDVLVDIAGPEGMLSRAKTVSQGIASGAYSNSQATIPKALGLPTIGVPSLAAVAAAGAAAGANSTANATAAQADLIAGLLARGASNEEIAAVVRGAPAGGAAWPFPGLPVSEPSARVSGATGSAALAGLGAIPGQVEFPFPTRAGPTIDTAKTNEAAAALNRVTEANKAAEAASAKFGIEQKAAQAYTQAFTAAINAGKDATSAEAAGTEAARHARADANIELAKSATLADMAAQGALKIVDGYRQSTEAGLQAAAAVKARSDALTTGVSYEQAYARALTESADAALTAAAQRYAAGQASLTSNQAVAAAAQQGVAAEREAQQVATATAQTQDAVNKARATGNAGLIEAADHLQAMTLEQVKANDAARASIALSNQTHDIADRQQVLELELSLQGQTSDEIAKQVSLLQAKQAIEKTSLPITDATAQAYLSQTASLANVNTALNNAQRSQQQLEDGIRGIADTIDQSIGQSIQNAFDNKTTIDWGQTLKNVLAQIVNQIAQIALIRPAIGSVLSALGFASASQQFGTFGSLLSAVGSATGGGGTSRNGTSTTGGSSLGIGNIPSPGGLLNGGGISNFINTAGYSTGLFSLAPSEAAVSTAALYGGGGEAAVEAGIQGVSGLGEGAIGASLGGILGIAAPVIGLLGAVLPLVLGGIGKGSQNNSSSANLGPNGQISLSGPNQANSQQASAVLQQLSPLVQALKSLGYNVPTVGATFGTKTGIQTGISGFDEVHYGSNAEAVAGTAQRLVDVLGKLNPGIKTFADLLGNVDKLTPTLKDTKATFDSLSGVFTTTQTNYQTLSKALMSADVSVTDVTKRFDQLGAAIIGAQIGKAGELIAAFLASGVKSVSDFASAYSNLSTMYQTAITEARAAHQAFTPITNDFSALAKQLQGPELQAALSGLTDSFKSLQPGQYAAALDQIGQVFNSIFAQASQFNVAGPDIWNTQDQAKANLRTAFNSQISDLILGFTNPAALAIKQEKAAGDARVADAKAIGANVTEVNKLNALSLQKVIDSTKTLTTASTAAAASVQDLAAAIAQLKGGELSGLSPGKQASQGFGTFEDLYKSAAWKSDPDAYAKLAQQGTSTVQLYQSAYGNGPQTEAYRQIILAQLQTAMAAGGAGFKTGSVSQQVQSILASVLGLGGGSAPGFAEGTMNTPPGPIIVGERGPELLFQRGGLGVMPHAANQNMTAVLSELKGLRGEVVALRRQTQGGQVRAHDDATEGNAHLRRINTTTMHAAQMTPRRRIS